LKSVLPRLHVLAKEARFAVEIQTILNDRTLETYDEFRATLKDFPFAFGFSVMHDNGGQIAIKGEKFLGVMEFSSRERRPPDDELFQMVATLGSQLGQFLERKHAEEALREGEERLRIALQAGQMGTAPDEHYVLVGAVELK